MMTEPATLEEEGLRYYEAGDYARAMACFRQAQQLLADQGDIRGVGEMWGNIGVVYYRQGQWQEAEDALRHALENAASARNRAGEAKTLGNMGSLYARQGNNEQAETCFEQAIAIFREIGDQEKAEDTLRALSALKLKHGRWLEAFYHYDRKLASTANPTLWQRFLRWLFRLLKSLLRLE